MQCEIGEVRAVRLGWLPGAHHRQFDGMRLPWLAGKALRLTQASCSVATKLTKHPISEERPRPTMTEYLPPPCQGHPSWVLR